MEINKATLQIKRRHTTLDRWAEQTGSLWWRRPNTSPRTNAEAAAIEFVGFQSGFVAHESERSDRGLSAAERSTRSSSEIERVVQVAAKKRQIKEGTRKTICVTSAIRTLSISLDSSTFPRKKGISGMWGETCTFMNHTIFYRSPQDALHTYHVDPC